MIARNKLSRVAIGCLLMLPLFFLLFSSQAVLSETSQEPFVPSQPTGFTAGALLVKFIPGVLPDDPRLSELMTTFDAQLVRTLEPLNYWRLFKLNTVTTEEETLQAREEFQKHELVEYVELNFIPFWDVLPGHWAFGFIHRIYSAGMTSGCGIADYCPDDPVSRGQMAVFLVTALGQSPAPCTGRFRDVPVGHPFCGFIERMFSGGAGITAGCNFGLDFCVDEPVTRAQMAVFIETALGNAPDACTGTRFTDVTPALVGAAFCGFIEQLAQDGITGGCTPTTFCPNDPVSRAQMAVYLWTAFLSQLSFQTSLTLKDAAGVVKTDFSVAEPMTFELTVSNLANSTRILVLPSSQRFEFLVGRDSGIIWNWSHDKGFLMVITELSFGPLETKTFSAVWNQTDNSGAQIQAGTYQAQGFVAGQETINLDLSPESPTRSPVSTFTIR